MHVSYKIFVGLLMAIYLPHNIFAKNPSIVLFHRTRFKMHNNVFPCSKRPRGTQASPVVFQMFLRVSVFLLKHSNAAVAMVTFG